MNVRMETTLVVLLHKLMRLHGSFARQPGLERPVSKGAWTGE